MRWGYNTNGFAHHRLEDALQILADLGYSSVALTLDVHTLSPFEANYQMEAQRIGALLKKHQMGCVVETGARFLLDPYRKHQPTLLSPTPKERDSRLQFLIRSVDIAHILEAPSVSFWSGSALDSPEEKVLWERLTSGCQTLADYARTKGVRLAFEPEPGMWIDTMDKFQALVDRVQNPNFGLTLDVGHLHCMGEGPIENQIRQWGPLLWNIHLEDMKQGVHEHLMFGEGEMDFPPIIRALKEVKYGGGIHVELSRHSHDAFRTAKRSLEFLRELDHNDPYYPPHGEKICPMSPG